MTSQLVIFRAFFLFVPPTLHLKEKHSRKSTNKKFWPKQDIYESAYYYACCIDYLLGLAVYGQCHWNLQYLCTQAMIKDMVSS